MSASPITVPPSLSVPEAQELMQRWLIRHLPVTEGERLVGIVTDWDIRFSLPPSTGPLTVWEINARLARLTVGEVMTRDVITIAPDRPLEEAAQVMLENRIGALPVVEQGRLLGILTETDLLRAFVRARARPGPVTPGA